MYRRFSGYRPPVPKKPPEPEPQPAPPPEPAPRPIKPPEPKTDPGELVILMILFVLYRNSGDEELLILLAVLALNWLR